MRGTAWWPLWVAAFLWLALPLPARAEPTAPPLNACPGGDDDGEARCPARVVLVRRGWVVIEASRPLVLGERFLLFSQRPVRGVDPSTRREGWAPEGEQTGMLVLERVRGQEGAGRLVRNAYAEAGDLAVPTKAPFRESLIYGRRHPRLWRVHGTVITGPIFGRSTALGLLGQGAVEYHFGVPLKLAIELAPLTLTSGLTTSASSPTGGSLARVPLGTLFTGSLRAKVALSLSGFELGVGLGGWIDSGNPAVGGLQVGIGARAGSLDGFHFRIDAVVRVPTGPLDRAVFDGAFGAFLIPVHRRVSLEIGSGGAPQWLYAQFGVRTYLVGTGGPGTWILGLAGGGGYFIGERTCPPLTTGTLGCVAGSELGAGPLFQVALDRRF